MTQGYTDNIAPRAYVPGVPRVGHLPHSFAAVPALAVCPSSFLRLAPRKPEDFRSPPDSPRGALDVACNRAGCFSLRHEDPQSVFFLGRPRLSCSGRCLVCVCCQPQLYRASPYSRRCTFQLFCNVGVSPPGLDERLQALIFVESPSLGGPCWHPISSLSVRSPNAKLQRRPHNCRAYGGLTPSHDGRPRVSRRCASEPWPRSGKLSNILSDASRTSPTVLKPAAASAFSMRVGN
jgi:hypothetical protein